MSLAKRIRTSGTSSARRHNSRVKTEPEVVPFITVDGHVYYADRFYLTTSVHDHDDDDDDDYCRQARQQQIRENSCTCGARHPPPLLDRSQLVASLDLKAAILATFSLDVKATTNQETGGRPTSRWLSQEFPSLFGPHATTPTLVLHGLRGQRDVGDSTANNEKDNDSCEELSVSQPYEEEYELIMASDHAKTSVCKEDDNVADVNDNTVDGDDDDSLCTQPSDQEHVDDTASSPSPIAAPVGPPPQPESVHFTQVLSAFLPPLALASLRSMGAPLITSNGYVSQAVIDRRKPGGAGVHHPKYMILLERSGSVVVVISTGNLTRPCAMDASWVQRFPAMDAMATTTESTTTIGSTPCDFGIVLADFLHQQTLACRPNQLTPLGFVRRYLQWNSLAELGRRFDYSKAQVHLVSTVPGTHSGRKRQQRHVPSICYGRQRVAQVLHQLSTSASCCWLPRCLLSADDRLLIQPTSLGADWNGLNMTMLVRSYLQHDNNDESSGDSSAHQRPPQRSRGTLLERMSILWPTRQWMKDIVSGKKRRRQNDDCRQVPLPMQQGKVKQRKRKAPAPLVDTTECCFKVEKSATSHGGRMSVVSSALTRRVSNVADTISNVDREEQTKFGNHLFLSSKIFNSYEHSILSQMAHFEPSYPLQRPKMLAPHIKSIARLFEGNEYALRQSFKFGKSQELFPWFLLTSGSLSRGAQGRLANENMPDDDSLRYANFELGVLFSSRLQGNKNSDRLYCWKPCDCNCRRIAATDSTARAKTTRLVHLPVPYSLRPSFFQASPDDTDFSETPFFHEIAKGTAITGNMRLTPYGAKRVAKVVLADRN